MKNYPLKQWQRFIITFEQWSTSWNIYIQSFSYSTAAFYNTFFTQCHLVKYKMPIWNSEIAIVLWGGLNTYIDHFNYVSVRYTAFPQPLHGQYFHLLQSYLFFWALQPEQFNFFLDSNTKNLPFVVCVSCVLVGLPAWAHFQLPRYRLAFPSSSTSFQDWPSPEGRWRFQLYALTNSNLSVTDGHQGIPCSTEAFNLQKEKTIKVLVLLGRREGPAASPKLWHVQFYITKKWQFCMWAYTNLRCPSCSSIFQHKFTFILPAQTLPGISTLFLCLPVCLSFSIFQSHREFPFHFPVPPPHLFTKHSHCNP